jgi:RecA/RadA recombinase
MISRGQIDSNSAKGDGSARATCRDHPYFERLAALDITLGIGGVPRGRVVEIYGPESSGKTIGSANL